MKWFNTGVVFVGALVLLYTAVGALVWREQHSRQQAVQFERQQQAQNDMAQVQRLAEHLLSQRQTQLSAITQFLAIQPDAIRTLIRQTPMLNHLLVIENGTLRYPLASDDNWLSEQEKRFVAAMQPLINDPTLLLQSAQTSEHQNASFGWFISTHQQQTALLYWEKKNAEQLIIYGLSYALFRAELIADIDTLNLTGGLKITDNGQILLLDGAPWREDSHVLTVSRDFPHPLAQWTLSYQPVARRQDIWVRFAPTFVAVAVLSLLTLIAILIYHGMQRRIRLAQQQVQFVSQVSHELKTPLTNINLYSQLLSERNHDDAQTLRYLGVIEQESQRLTRLIQNVLDFNSAPVLSLHEVRVVELLEGIQQTFTPSFSAKGIAIHLQLDEGIDAATTVNSNRDKLTQILANLMSNAEKYAYQSQRVELRATRTRQHVILSVRDYGQGVTRQALKQLFKPFYRVNNQLTEGVSGTGIGLTICQQLAESMNASLKAENCERGMRFSVLLPVGASTGIDTSHP